MTGRYGHTASYDWFTDSVYIAGGNQKRLLSADLLVFEVLTAKWYIIFSSNFIIHNCSVNKPCSTYSIKKENF